METATKPVNEFVARLGLLDATMIVAGSMIGSGIFIVAAEVTRSVGGAGWMLAMWLLAGLVTVIAAVSYGELAAMFPRAGGQYVYLREAYNPLVGFLYGWSFFAVIQTGTIAAVGVAFAKFTAYLIPAFSDTNFLLDLGFFRLSAAQLVSIFVIVLLTYVNSRGVKEGAALQTFLTIVKLLSLFGLIICGFIWGAKADVWNANWQNAWHLASLTKNGDALSYTTLSALGAFGAIAIAMKGTLFSSDSWHSITSIAGEVKRPERNIGLSLVLGTLVVTVIYVLTNLMYLAVVPLNDIAFAPSDRVGVVAADYIFGNSGTIIIALMVMISTFGCNNGLILSGARVYYIMAKDGLFFRKAGQLNQNDVPGYSLWMQCLWASVLCLTGEYNNLLALVIFGVLIFYILTILGIYRLRRLQPDLPRPYKAPGYPYLPAVYVVIALALAVLLLFFETKYTLPGLGIILAGIPIYYWLIRQPD
ncbi:Y+L amino acid transporter 1 y(+)L-type amino acid transporter 1 [Fibrella aestuarina BUZ 2]|uniref:Y+L amino acid transporter 1 y(+)L-type amino acid transporter 1 n=1 Tax=Fibrella aestuarina BUZ 2 TaxID=1166018 RepID=I0KE71_9BACT|nr:amino acid permease [Fibrella aestuarina]CCH02424.1 Y+L amino acid transporter 1 y(+)L-type amino acid transporter 1 [Fibrella aestuarina BUZ 2]